MARILPTADRSSAPPGAQRDVINGVARRQYGRWAVQYRSANIAAAVRRDVGKTSPVPPAPSSPAPMTRTIERLRELQRLRNAGTVSDAESEVLKTAALAG
jgi:hypothetical protein